MSASLRRTVSAEQLLAELGFTRVVDRDPPTRTPPKRRRGSMAGTPATDESDSTDGPR